MMNTPDQPTDSPGRQMFGQFIQQESASTDDLPQPDAFSLDMHAMHVGARFHDHVLGHGQLAAQAFHSGLLVSGLQAGLQHDMVRTNSVIEAPPPCLVLELMMGGHVQWTDRHGVRHRSGTHGEIWCFSGLPDWREYTMLPGQLSQAHITADPALLARWLEDLPRGQERQHLEQYLDAMARGTPRMLTTAMPAAMAGMAAHLQTQLQDCLHLPTLSQRLQIEGLATSLLGGLARPARLCAGSAAPPLGTCGTGGHRHHPRRVRRRSPVDRRAGTPHRHQRVLPEAGVPGTHGHQHHGLHPPAAPALGPGPAGRKPPLHSRGGP